MVCRFTQLDEDFAMMGYRVPLVCTLAALAATVSAQDRLLMPDYGVSATFSIVAADPDAGVCGAAVASKYPSVGKVVPYVRAGVGAFCTQHWHNPQFGPRALELLAAGKLPEEVLGELLRDDDRRDKRQLAIIDLVGRAANRNPSQPDPSGVYWGAMSGRNYACQGNTLTGPEVLIAMSKAFDETKGTLADRLMSALVAGDRAGGDHRGRLAAGIRVARKGIDGVWLELDVDKSDDAVRDLARSILNWTTTLEAPGVIRPIHAKYARRKIRVPGAERSDAPDGWGFEDSAPGTHCYHLEHSAGVLSGQERFLDHWAGGRRVRLATFFVLIGGSYGST